MGPKPFLFILPLLFFMACNKPILSPPDDSSTEEESISETPTFIAPKNVILLIGDGMGLGQISAGLFHNNNQLNLERFKIVGIQKPNSADNLISDSAAAATALSTGVKTNNGAIGVTPSGNSVPTLIELAEAKNKATGMVTTSTIVHATPASFIAHVPSRNQFEDIATAFLTTEIDYFVGGGKKYFSQRKDGRNLLEELQTQNYAVHTYLEHPLTELEIDFTKNFAYLSAHTDPVPFAKGRTYLEPATKLACNFLKRHNEDQGFFLMVEGAQIDWACHANDTEYLLSEMIEFDQTIGAVLDFAEENKETLVIVTADHETGGFAINPGSTAEEIKGAFTSDYHTAVLIPVFAFGPGAKLFSGLYENTAIFDRIIQAAQY